MSWYNKASLLKLMPAKAYNQIQRWHIIAKWDLTYKQRSSKIRLLQYMVGN